MNLLKNLSIKTQMIIFFLLIAVLTLFLCAFLFISSDLKMLKKSTIRNLTVLAETVGDNCVASLLFDDHESASKILSSLKRECQIHYSILYNAEGDIFAVYKMNDNVKIQPPHLQGEEHLLDYAKEHKRDIEIVRNIIFENEIIGKVFLHGHMSELEAQQKKYLLLVTFLLVLTLIVSVFLSLNLQKFITKPILSLADKAKTISEQGKYDITVKYESKNELGVLYSSFNKMISRVKQREQEMINIQDNLEQLVEERTNELSKAKNAAETATQAKSTFLAHMSHELRTPLNAIIGLADLAVRTKDERKRDEYMKLVSSSGKFLGGLVNNILDLSKIESGKLVLEEIPFDLCKTIQEAAAPIGFQAHQKKLNFHLFLDQSIPRMIYGDPLRLRQIIMNLADNAIKFTDKGEVNIDVKVEDVTETGAKIHFTIKDTGKGIPKDKQEGIFESFTQVDASTTRKYGGSGLGTTISRELVKLMNGYIRIESTLGKGTCVHFVISFNICKKELVDLISNQQLHKPDNLISKDNCPLNILVVEDNLLNQKVSIDILKILGHKVLTADNGKIALEMWEKGDYDLILMDIMMPEMDGFQTTRAIRKKEKNRNKRVPIIALTAQASKEIIEKGIVAGMDNFIFKPVDFDKLEKKIGWASIEKAKEMENDREKKKPDEEGEDDLPAPWPPSDQAFRAGVRQAGFSKGELPTTIPPHQVETKENALFDLSYLREKLDYNDNKIESLLEWFKEDSNNLISTMEKAVKDNDPETMAKSAHKLEGSARQIKAIKLQHLANELEELGREWDLTKAADKLTDLKFCYNRLLQELEKG